MGALQPLRGGSNKFYNVMADFSKGIDKMTADDIASDSSFRDLKNFYSESEGALSKRPGVYNSNFVPFISRIISGVYSDKFTIINNRFGETKDTLITRLTDFYNTVLCGEKKSKYHQSLTETRYFEFDKIIGFQIIKNNKFLEAMQDYETILNGEYSSYTASSLIEFSCIVVAGGFTTIKKDGEDNEKNKTCGLYLARLNIKMEYTANQGYSVVLELDTVDPTVSASENRRWVYYPSNYNLDKNSPYINESDEYRPLGPIDVVSYNGFSYLPSGKDYLIKIDQTPNSDTKEYHETYPEESSIFQIIGGEEGDGENLYTPTAIEVMQIGFNILSNDPLALYDTSGATGKIKGVFYSVYIDKVSEPFYQPVAKVPYNNKFNVNVIYTGENRPSKIEYREDNGETDPEINKYKTLPGEWKNQNIYECSGIDSNQRFELRITLGDDVFVSYIETTTNTIDETGYINTISDLVLSSKRMKVINNQLVLYGGHGYMFFSEYDAFNYFPNYYYIYIASEAGEEEIKSVNYFRQYYAVFTNKRIKKMVGAFGADDFGIYPLNDFVGCANGYTIRAIGNNLFFLGSDGIYKLKQGYLGEGTENVEKIDNVIAGALNLSNVLQAFTMNNNYVIVKNDGYSWYVYNTLTEAFYEYDLESLEGQVYTGDALDESFKKKAMPFYSIFESNLYDANGAFFVVPMYKYEYNRYFTTFTRKGLELMTFRFSDLNFIEYDKRHKDGYGFISSFETHSLNMGYPTHNKKFKEIYIKMLNDSGHVIPLYLTIQIDDNEVIKPDDYTIIYNETTNTYYYVRKVDSNYALDISKALGEFTLGVDKLGNRTIQQIKIRVSKTGKAIKIKLSDGYNDLTEISTGGSANTGIPVRNRNNYNFTVSTIGIVYKLKKVKEG